MIKKYVFPVLLAAAFFSGCKDDEFGPVLKIGNPPAITAPAANSSFVLKESTGNGVFSPFTWTAAEYGFDAGVNYTLELDVKGNDFKDAVTVGSVNALSLDGITQGKINNILLSKGLPGEEEKEIQFRLAAKVNPDVPVVYSQPVTVKITPYTVVIIYPQLQVPGSYQGWDPANNNTVIFSAKSDNKYEGYINFPDANSKFKYTLGPSWATNWGDTGADGTLDKDGTDIGLTDAGVYKLNANLNDLTHSYTRTEWGLIGSATPDGWNSDQNMTYDPATNKWTITLNLVAGEIKFRANDDWAINFGDTGANKSLEYGGDNIAVADAGNYTIDLILSGAVYTYKIKKN